MKVFWIELVGIYQENLIHEGKFENKPGISNRKIDCNTKIQGKSTIPQGYNGNSDGKCFHPKDNAKPVGAACNILMVVILKMIDATIKPNTMPENSY